MSKSRTLNRLTKKPNKHLIECLFQVSFIRLIPIDEVHISQVDVLWYGNIGNLATDSISFFLEMNGVELAHVDIIVASLRLAVSVTMTAARVVVVPLLATVVRMIRRRPSEPIVKVSVVPMDLDRPAYHAVPTGNGELGRRSRFKEDDAASRLVIHIPTMIVLGRLDSSITHFVSSLRDDCLLQIVVVFYVNSDVVVRVQSLGGIETPDDAPLVREVEGLSHEMGHLEPRFASERQGITLKF